MIPRDLQSTRLRRAFVALTVVLSLVLVWIGARPHAADWATRGTMAGLSAVSAADHAVTLSAPAKGFRASEVRPGSDPDLIAFLPETGSVLGQITPAACLCADDAPAGPDSRTRPQPRAPPAL